MALIYFHNLLSNDPVDNLVILGFFLVCALGSTYFVVYGIYSLISLWNYLTWKLKFFFAITPALAILAISVFPDSGVILSFPFGLFSGILAFILTSIAYGSEHWIPDVALPFFGLILNVCGVVGLIRRVSKLFGYR